MMLDRIGFELGCTITKLYKLNKLMSSSVTRATLQKKKKNYYERKTKHNQMSPDTSI